ncbi:MAG TPA: hypothetical protein VMD30_05245 [Tepidisphaeraceae bacterium]|nr:hypothetical protein [Tepidisphaeraceae bacterium]
MSKAKVLFGCLAVAGSLAALVLIHARMPHVRFLDLSSDRSISRIPWPKDMAWSDYTGWDRVTVSLKFGGGRDFNGHLAHLLFTRNGDKIDAVSLLFGAATIQETYTQAITIARQWGIPTATIDAWLAKARQGDVEQIEINNNSAFPSLSLDIIPSGDPAVPSCLGFQVEWLRF